jgi:ATP-dependent DNA helicase DinG
MEQFRPKTTPPLANPERLTGHCEELYELIASLNAILNLYMPAGQEAEHRFPMGELPQEVMDICQRLAKLTEMLRGLAELFLNDLGEKTGSHDVVRLHRVLLQMNRALGMFESQSKLWRLASLAQSSGAPVTKWVTRDMRDGQTHIWFHCVGIRVSDQLERLLWRSVPHIVVTSATLRSLNSFSRLQEMSGLKEKAGDRFVALDSPLTMLSRAKSLFRRCTMNRLSITKSSILLKWQLISASRLKVKSISGCWCCSPAGGRCSVSWNMFPICACSCWYRAISRATGWWNCTASASKGGA